MESSVRPGFKYEFFVNDSKYFGADWTRWPKQNGRGGRSGGEHTFARNTGREADQDKTIFRRPGIFLRDVPTSSFRRTGAGLRLSPGQPVEIRSVGNGSRLALPAAPF